MLIFGLREFNFVEYWYDPIEAVYIHRGKVSERFFRKLKHPKFDLLNSILLSVGDGKDHWETVCLRRKSYWTVYVQVKIWLFSCLISGFST